MNYWLDGDNIYTTHSEFNNWTKDILNINTILLDFHKGLTQYSLTNLQEKNRKLWEDFFSFPGFIHHLIYQIKKELN